METVTITARGCPILEVTLDDEGQAAEMVERDESGEEIRRWEASVDPGEPSPNCERRA